jgi:glycosyltransferase involved in cell wall biosynthesis
LNAAPPATVLIPARNEAADIEACLRAVADQGYPHLEVIVSEGGSTDDTASRARALMAELGLTGRVLSPGPGEGGSTPENLNRGLAAATGEILCRVDARSIVPPGYVGRCAAVLTAQPDVAVVGGAQVAMPRSEAPRDLGIARALNNRWGMGLARYRRDAPSGPSDTVYLGAFRTEELRRAGGWDVRYSTNQDFELNRRMSRTGTIWYESGLPVGYVPRPGLRPLFRQYHRFGRWKARYWRQQAERPQPRQLVLLGLPIAAAIGLLGITRLGGRGRVATTLGGLVGLVLFERRGPTGPDGPPAAHLWSLAASAAVGVGWTSGVWRELSVGGGRDGSA